MYLELVASIFNENIEFTSTFRPRRTCKGKIISRNIVNTASYSIEKISRSVTVIRQIWQVSSETRMSIGQKVLSRYLVYNASVDGLDTN